MQATGAVRDVGDQRVEGPGAASAGRPQIPLIQGEALAVGDGRGPGRLGCGGLCAGGLLSAAAGASGAAGWGFGAAGWGFGAAECRGLGQWGLAPGVAAGRFLGRRRGDGGGLWSACGGGLAASSCRRVAWLGRGAVDAAFPAADGAGVDTDAQAEGGLGQCRVWRRALRSMAIIGCVPSLGCSKTGSSAMPSRRASGRAMRPCRPSSSTP